MFISFILSEEIQGSFGNWISFRDETNLKTLVFEHNFKQVKNHMLKLTQFFS